MTASEFAALLHAKQIRRGHWMARCPAHADKRPSLAISEGNMSKGPFPFSLCCMSQGCTGHEILKALGLKWKDVLGTRPSVSREASRRLRDEQTLHALLDLKRATISPAGVYLAGKQYRLDGLRGMLERRIIALQNRLSPELKAVRERDAKTARFVRRWGWDRLWQLYFERSEEFKEGSTPAALGFAAVVSNEQGSTRPIPTGVSDISVTTEAGLA
jgi:hypothetical protein